MRKRLWSAGIAAVLACGLLSSTTVQGQDLTTLLSKFLKSLYAGQISIGSTGDALLSRDAANTIAQRNGTTAQAFRVYNTYATAGTDYERYGVEWGSNRARVGTFAGGTGSVRAIDLIGNTFTFLPSGALATTTGEWFMTTTGFFPGVTNTTDIGASSTGQVRSIYKAGITPAASVAAGGTVNLDSDVTDTRYQITISPAAGDCSTAFIAAALTADCTIATISAGMKLVGVYADVTAGFTCSATCVGTKTIGAGKTAGGVEILAAGLNVAATGTFGLADADLGTAMVRAAQIQGGYLNSWSATTPVIVRFTSGTGNWGTGAATNVNAGTVKFTLMTQQIK